MQVKESIQKTRNLVHKTLQNLKSAFHGSKYQKLSRSLSFNPLSCGRKVRNQCSSYFNDDFYNEWESSLEKPDKKKKTTTTTSSTCVMMTCKESTDVVENFTPLKKKQEEKTKRSCKSAKMDNEEVCVLAQKMKQLELTNIGDMEQVLDIEEALHYYSRLKSPVYVDMVDNFFTNMYSELSVPQASASIDNSKRRLTSFRV